MVAHVDYLRGTSQMDLDTVLMCVSRATNSDAVVLEHAYYGYERAYDVGGVIVMDAETRPEMGVCVQISGEVCEELGHETLAVIYHATQLRVSRIDLAIDHCPFTPADLHREWIAGNVRTRVRRVDGAQREWRRCSWISSPDGDTFYMGSRTSERFVRCYDTRGFTRIELETKGDQAKALAREVFETHDPTSARNIAQTAISAIRGFADFVRRSKNGQNDRLLPFWEKFVRGAEKLVLHLEQRARRGIYELAEYVAYAWGPSLAAIEAVFGGMGVLEIIDYARHRMRPKHRILIRDAMRARVADYAGVAPLTRPWMAAQ